MTGCSVTGDLDIANVVSFEYRFGGGSCPLIEFSILFVSWLISHSLVNSSYALSDFPRRQKEVTGKVHRQSCGYRDKLSRWKKKFLVSQ